MSAVRQYVSYRSGSLIYIAIMNSIRLLILVLFLVPCHLLAQTYVIRGKVLDAETMTPLKGASVYINNTTKGTTTNEDGDFEISSLRSGSYDLVVSYVGFESLLYPVIIGKKDFRIRFQLDREEKQMRDILILSNETRLRYLKLFKENLLGFTDAARRCKIRNIDAVGFANGTTQKDIVAFADTVLVIENPELGYTIHFTLVDFYFNPVTGESRFFGFTRFEDWGEGETTNRKWKRRREMVYVGSSQHFYRSLFNRKLQADGFTMQNVHIVQMPVDSEKIKMYGKNIRSERNVAVPVTEDSLLKVHADTINKVYELKIADWLKVVYKKNTALKIEISRTIFLAGQPNVGTSSGIHPRQRPILMDNRGVILNAMNFYYDGMWSFERLANMLPEDYEPD